MKTSSAGRAFGSVVLQLAVGVMLAVAGIWALQGGGDFAVRAVGRIFNGTSRNIAVIAFAVVEVLIGLFTILRVFIGSRFGAFGTALHVIAIIVWGAAIVLSDVIGAGAALRGGVARALEWAYAMAQHLIVFGALLL